MDVIPAPGDGATVQPVAVHAAAALLAGVANRTPVVTSRHLDGRLGASVFLKCENFQRTGSFKFRGAFHAVAKLGEREGGLES